MGVGAGPAARYVAILTANILEGAAMSVLQRSFFVLALASLIASASLGGATAQTEAVREACQTSVHLLCPKEVAAMDRTAARA